MVGLGGMEEATLVLTRLSSSFGKTAHCEEHTVIVL